MSDVILQCKNLCRTFGAKSLTTEVLKNINLKIKKSERVAVVGASGSGKSTLLHLLGGLDKETSGSVEILGENISKLKEKQVTLFRNSHLGFIYQFNHLLPEFTALENVAIPLWIGKQNKKKSLQKAKKILIEVDLEHRLNHRPAELSGGERQRVAIARAMVNQPEIILADEPTGNLDDDSAYKAFDLMNQLNIDMKTTLIMVTHNKNLADKMDRIIELKNKTLQTRVDL